MSNGNPQLPGGPLPDVVNTAQAPTPAPPAATSLQAPYAVRKIDLTFTLGSGGTFNGSGANQLTITGLRTLAHLEYVASPYGSLAAVLRVYGMTIDHMNAISVAGLLFEGRPNTNSVKVSAGDAISGMTVVADCGIVEAYPKFDGGADDRHFYIYAAGVSPEIRLKSADPTSYPSSVPASQVFETLAKQAGLTLQNDGVTVVLASPYLWGTIWQQIQSAARAADCLFYHDPINKILRIWPKNGPTSGSQTTIIVSPQTGMIGYPMFQTNQIIVRTLFNPQIAVGVPGRFMQVKSQLGAANNAKLWISSVTHDLSSQMPGGPWETTVVGVPQR